VASAGPKKKEDEPGQGMGASHLEESDGTARGTFKGDGKREKAIVRGLATKTMTKPFLSS